MAEVQRQGGGAALKQAIHVAREQAGITSDTQLAVQADVSYDTLMNWFGNRTTPRPAELKKVADVLGARLVDLMDAYEGRDPQPPSLEAAILSLVDEMRVALYEARLARAQQEESTAAILRALGAVAPRARAHRETPRGSEAAERAGSS